MQYTKDEVRYKYLNNKTKHNTQETNQNIKI